MKVQTLLVGTLFFAATSCKVNSSMSNTLSDSAPKNTPEANKAKVKEALEYAKTKGEPWQLVLTDAELKKEDKVHANACNDLDNAKIHVRNYFFYTNNDKYVEAVKARIQKNYLETLPIELEKTSNIDKKNVTTINLVDLTTIVDEDMNIYFLDKFKSAPSDSYFRAFLKSSICESNSYKVAEPWKISAGFFARQKAEAYLIKWDQALLSVTLDILADRYVAQPTHVTLSTETASCTAKRYVTVNTMGGNGKTLNWAPLKSDGITVAEKKLSVSNCSIVSLPCDTSKETLDSYNAKNGTKLKSVAEIKDPFKIPAATSGGYAKIVAIDGQKSDAVVLEVNGMLKKSPDNDALGKLIQTSNLRESEPPKTVSCANHADQF